MSKILPKLTGDWISCEQSAALMAMFARNGYTARFVGGAVRNALLGEPVNDLDIATDALPQSVMEMAQEAGFKAVGTGLDHGTVTVIVTPRVYEITTLRVDVETHGRQATVAFTGDWVEDARRRDFTMNALYASIDGTLFDPLGGLDDLRTRRVRFIGKPEDRIKEDYLRILRFFRFSAQYGHGKVDERGLAACVRLQKGLGSLSSERVRSELMRLLVMPRVVEVFEIMFAHGLVLPLTARVPHLERFKKWLLLERQLEREPGAIDRLGASSMLVLEDAAALTKRLRLSNDEKRALSRWAASSRISGTISEKQARILLYRHREDYQTIVAINWLLSGADKCDKSWRKLHDLPERWQCPVFPVKGQDLLDKGMTPGPSVGKKLLILEQAWIDSDFTLPRNELLNQLNTQH